MLLSAWARGRCEQLAPPDLEPSVSLTSPADQATVSGTTTITADASDDDAVESVAFTVDGVTVGTDTDGTDGWSTQWDTTTSPDGPVTLGAVATDTADQTGEAETVVATVENVP